MEGESSLSWSRRDVLRGLGVGITAIGIGAGVGSARPDASPEIEWDRTYGSTGPEFSVDRVSDVVETPAGYVFTGRSQTEGGGWLVVVDPDDGAVTSMWIYPELLPDALVATDDGGYLLAGRESAEVFSPAALVKTDADGEVEWREFYGAIGLGVDELIRTADGGYALVGSGGEEGEADLDFALVKVDSEGREEWSQRYDNGGVEVGRSLVEATDGGFVLAGFTTPEHGDERNAWLVRTDAEGHERWTAEYGGICSDEAASIVRADGGYVFLGDTRSPPTTSGDSDLWLVGVDSDGAERWTRTYGDLDGVGGHSGTLVAVDDGYAFTGSIDGAFGLGRVDDEGREEWIRTIPRRSDAPFENDHPTELLATSDGGYLVAGVTGVPSGEFNARLVKLR